MVNEKLDNEIQEPWIQEHKGYVNFINKLIEECDEINDQDDELTKQLKLIFSKKRNEIYSSDTCFRPIFKLQEIRNIIVENSIATIKKKMEYQILILKKEIEEQNKDENKILGISLGILTTVFGFLINQQGGDILLALKRLFNN